MLSFATAAWSAVRGFRSERKIDPERQILLDRLATAEREFRDGLAAVRAEMLADRQCAEKRHEELFALIARGPRQADSH